MDDTATAFKLDPLDVRHDAQVFPRLTKLVEDEDFAAGWKDFDVEGFVDAANEFSTHITRYNEFHRRERRLWSVKLGKGSIPRELEDSFRATVPHGKEAFVQAFEALDRCLDTVDRSPRFKAALNRHLPGLSRRHLFDAESILGQGADAYFRAIGCSEPMVAEFKSHFRKTGYDFIGVLGGGDVSNLRAVARKGVAAHVEVLDHTHEHGFDYIRGSGPPAWAIAISNILASVGIAITAWAVVAIVALIIVTVILICAARILPSGLQNACNFVANFFNFSF